MTPISNLNGRSYKVWAEDAAAYGPVDVATLAQWIQEDRVFPETFVQPQSDLRWRPAAKVDSLQEIFTTAVQAGMEEATGGTSAVVAALREFPLFSVLTTEGLEQIAALGKCHDFEKGEVIVRQGDPGDAVYFVLSGELRVRLLVGVVDRIDKTLCKLGPGELFGELGLLLQSKRTADVIAEQPSRVFCMTTNAFQLLVKQVPEVASPLLFNLSVTMARRIAADNQRFYREVTSQFVWS